MESDESDSRGLDPGEILECTECGRIYSGAKTSDGGVHPAGTDGSCNCGNDEFHVATGE